MKAGRGREEWVRGGRPPRPTPHDSSTAAKGSWGCLGTHPAAHCSRRRLRTCLKRVCSMSGLTGLVGRSGQGPGWGPGLPETQAEG